MFLCTRGTDRSPLSLTGLGSLCFHTQIHVLVSVTADRRRLADIAAVRHAHRHLSDAAGKRAPPARSRAPQLPGGAEAVKRQPPRDLEPPCGSTKSYGCREVVNVKNKSSTHVP